MKVLTSSQIRSIDQQTIELDAIASIELMERAAETLCAEIMRSYDSSCSFIFCCGPGNNGGDGLAMARLLQSNGYEVVIWMVDLGQLSPDNRTNLDRLESSLIQFVMPGERLPFPQDMDCILVDCLFGSGLSRPVGGNLAQMIEEINSSNVKVISIDVPSGMSDSGPIDGACIRADETLVIQIPRCNLFVEDCQEYLGKWRLVEIGLSQQAIDKTATHVYYVDKKYARNSLPEVRSSFSHKGTYGHALLVAGSQGMNGAALLACKACLRSGVGKLTMHVPRCAQNLIHSHCPEALVQSDRHQFHVSQIPDTSLYNIVGIGCGLGQQPDSQKAIDQLLNHPPKQLVMDADALNIVAINDWLKRIPRGTILTPHPGEFDRLFPSRNPTHRTRIATQLEQSKELGIFIVLKGHYTSVSTPDGTLYFNGSGNPGMATGGSGDVLTGMMTALISQCDKVLDAVISAVWLHGYAADLALVQGQSFESLLPRDIIESIGNAFHHTRSE